MIDLDIRVWLVNVLLVDSFVPPVFLAGPAREGLSRAGFFFSPSLDGVCCCCCSVRS